jgi:hypothetical protein
MRKDEKREVTPEFVNMSKEILYPQIQGVTCGLRHSRGPSPRSVLAAQVQATSVGKVRWNVKSIRIPAGVRHRHHDSRW